MTRRILSGMQCLVNQQWLSDHAIVVEDAKIKAIIPSDMITHHLPAIQHHFSQDHFLMPGLMDLHVHGVGGHDVMDAEVTALQAIRRQLSAEGVTGFLATTMAAPQDRLAEVLTTIVAAQQSAVGAQLLGVHLEGPYLARGKCGAQMAHHLQTPDLKAFNTLQTIAQQQIKIVTLAPELSGATDFIHALTDSGVIAAIGHTDATYAQTCTAIDAGAHYATHLFNAMRGLHHREPGAVGALLLDQRVVAELIVDGVHLHPAIVALAYAMKGKDHLLLVTDAMRAKCLGDGVYELGGQQVTVAQQRACLADGTLAGSVLRMPQAIRQMAQFSGCSWIDAIHMATVTPARVLGLDQAKGAIDVGKDADLVVMDANDQVVLTLVLGEQAYPV